MRPLFGEVPTKNTNTVDALSYKTVSANRETVSKKWLLIDADNLVIGRLSSQVAKILRGKHKPDFTPHVDGGDNVIIINAAKVKMTGNKFNDKVYTRYTGYPGGQRFTTPGELMNTHPERIIELAIRRMLPKNRLGKKVFGNVYVYPGTEHPHAAQNPTLFDIKPLL